MDGWTRIKGGAKYADAGTRTFRKWLKKGLKHSRLPSGTILIRYADIDEFLERYQVKDDLVDKIVDETIEEIQHE